MLPARSNNIANMSSAGFTSPFGANSNPFGGSGRGDSAPMFRVVEEDENDAVASPTSPGFGLTATSSSLFHAPFGHDSASDSPTGLRSPPNPESYPAQYNFARRTSVSAESLKPVADTYDNWTPPVHPKTAEQLDRLKKAISGNFLFSHLDDEQSAQILGALVEKPIPTKGIKASRPFPSRRVTNADSFPRSSHKAMLATSFTWWKRGPLMSMSTPKALFNQGPTAWARTWARLKPAVPLASLP